MYGIYLDVYLENSWMWLEHVLICLEHVLQCLEYGWNLSGCVPNRDGCV